MAEGEFILEDSATIEATFVMDVTEADHNALFNRDIPDQHPISAITGLADALDTTSNAIIAEKDRAEGVEGSLDNLTTEDKNNLVSAINEVDSHTDTNARNLANHIADKSNPHEVTKAQVGLGNVDNTSDANKPISTATQTALNNITNGTTSIAYDNTSSGLSATTLQGAIDEVDSNLDDVEALIPGGTTTSNQLTNKSYVDTADGGLQNQITANAGDIDTIEGKIPSAASSSNQLADKNFVNSSIATNTANFIGTFNSVADLEAYSGTLTNNDYAFVIVTDSLGNTAYDRYKYTTATTPASWLFEYELNNSSFTAGQWAAINSGITSGDVALIATALQPNDNISELTNDSGYLVSSDIATGSANGTISVDGSDVSVYGLGSAAYTASTAYDASGAASTAETNAKNYADSLASNYATAAQGTLADTALQSGDNISELVNNAGYITGITSSDVTTALGYTPYNSSNPSGYQANVIETVKVNGTALTPSSKAVDISVPTVTSTYSATGTDAVNGTAVASAISGKANVGLDNLNASGQMIIDSQNGTVSNCILEIPQNVKVEISSNVVTLKSGSVIVNSGEAYQTYTLTSDVSIDLQNMPDGFYPLYIHIYSGGPTIMNPFELSKVVSGATDSLAGTTYHTWFDTNTKQIKHYGGSSSSYEVCYYPFCLIQVSNGTVSFAKDSNGNDMIFNGCGFIGHHAFVYPNVSGLIPSGFNTDGTLKSTYYTVNSLAIFELPNTSSSNLYTLGIVAYGTGAAQFFMNPSVETRDEIVGAWVRIYVESENKTLYFTGSEYRDQGYTPLLYYTVSAGTVTDFTIRQPYEGARDLLTDSLQADVTTLTGYDSTQTQTLKNINGVLTWVTD